MANVIFDIETDGLELDKVTVVHCIAAIDADTTDERTFGPDQIQEGLIYLSGASTLIGHNIIHYDLPVLRRLHGFSSNAMLLDTLILSRLLFPDRRVPLNYFGKKGPHSLEVWGHRVGRAKPEHEEWGTFSPAMMHRCLEDVRINLAMYQSLYREAQ